MHVFIFKGRSFACIKCLYFFFVVVVVVFFPGAAGAAGAGGAGGVFLERPPGRAPGAGGRRGGGEAGRRGGWERGRRRREQDDQGRQIASIGR